MLGHHRHALARVKAHKVLHVYVLCGIRVYVELVRLFDAAISVKCVEGLVEGCRRYPVNAETYVCVYMIFSHHI